MPAVLETRRAVAYDVLPSPVGPLLAARSEVGLRMLAFDADPALTAEGAEAHLGAPARRYPEELLDVRRQLDEYFAGRRDSFDVPLDLRPLTPFARRVLEATSLIPYGRVASYGDIAHAVGLPGAARAVGQALHRNPTAIVVPCHRVTGATGALTGYGGGLRRKEVLLALEGVRWPHASIETESPN